MLDVQDILKNIRRDMDYHHSTHGVCVGYAEKGIDAFLVNEYDSVFVDRIYYLKEQKSQLPALFERAKMDVRLARALDKKLTEAQIKELGLDTTFAFSEEEIDRIFDAVAFIDQAELYMYPFDYPDLFCKNLTQSDVKTIAQYAQPYALLNMGGKSEVNSFIGIYSKEELIKLLSCLNKLAENYGENFVLRMDSDNHRIGLCYSKIDDGWVLIDTTLPLLNPISRTDDHLKNIAAFLQFTFGNARYSLFRTTIVVTGHCYEIIKPHVDALINSDEFKSLHDITPERALLENGRGATLAWLAATFGNMDVIHELIKFYKTDDKAVDFNKSGAQGMPLVYTAAQNGHHAVIRALGKLKTKDGELAVDFNKPNINGDTPACISAQKGLKNVMRALSILKTKEGDLAVDFNKSNKNGATPVYFAAQNNHSRIIRILGRLKNNKGGLAVDFNKATNTGATPAYIASQNGHHDVIRTLGELKTREGGFAVNFNQPFDKGATIAFVAALYGHIKVLCELARLKSAEGIPIVNFSQPIDSGQTPVDVAREYNHRQVARFLLKQNRLGKTGEDRKTKTSQSTKYHPGLFSTLAAEGKNHGDSEKFCSQHRAL
ncbi:ankyrin repeat domain-containing protein [Legionella spiritensis]|uniref:ankyrin repeat domain-containing protein n=1 Tax=Legionella spiritensis TaxID=452 RepID=UPI000F6F4A0F|nr:ankyrin repeat domain-containing protein [Legionella spiritensis]VEG91777.1 Ribulose-5-phosphate 4-epimerase and related epimerases and aldolases [Legionella spiritensis]